MRCDLQHAIGEGLGHLPSSLDVNISPDWQNVKLSILKTGRDESYSYKERPG